MDHSGNGFQRMENPIKLKVVSVELGLALAAAVLADTTGHLSVSPGKWDV